MGRWSIDDLVGRLGARIFFGAFFFAMTLGAMAFVKLCWRYLFS